MEVAKVGCRNRPPGAHRCRRDNTIVRADIAPGRRELRPQACMHARSDKVERKRRDDRQDRLDKRLPATPVLSGRSMHTVQQLAGGDRRDRDLLILADRLCKTLSQQHTDVSTQRCARLALKVHEHRRV
jgi:hypothetical protein